MSELTYTPTLRDGIAGSDERATSAPDPGLTRDAEGKHAVVIGSGFGGLAAAIRLGARGFRVTVLDRLDAAGGRAKVIKQDGFTFDAGPTIVTAPFLFEELWQLCGRDMAQDIDLRSLDPFYRIRFDDGSHFDYSGNADEMCRQISRFSVADVEGWKRLMQASKRSFKVGFEDLADAPFSSPIDMLKVVPELARLQGHRSVYSLVSQYIRDDRLRSVFSFHPTLIGGNPFSVSSVYILINHLEQQWGVHFPMGGTGALVNGLVNLIESQGNTVRYNTEVKQILLEGKRACGVQLADGERIHADVVVSNADSAWTYGELLPDTVKRRWNAGKLKRASYSMGVFLWYFGTDRQYPEVPHHAILLGPRYRGLLQDIFKRKKLADDFSLYLHHPSVSDPSLAPEGCDTFYVLSPVPNLDADVDWREQAEPYRRRVEAYLERAILPGLSRHVVSSKVSTPIDFEQNLLSYRGAAFGLEPALTQSAWFRPNNRSEDIENLYLVGAGTHPGAGLPGVLSSARVLDKVLPNAQLRR